jgi:hypothetical protein
MSSSTHDNAFAFQTKVHLFVSPSRQTTLNSALQRALKHFNNACSTTRGSIFIWSVNDDKGETPNTTNLANKQATHQTSLFPTTDRKSTILNSFLIRPTFQFSHLGKNTAICRSCVWIQSHELRTHSHFPRLHDKALSLWVKDTLRQKHALALCTERK